MVVNKTDRIVLQQKFIMADTCLVENFSFSCIVQDRIADVRLIDKTWLVAVDLAVAMSGKSPDHAGRDVRDLKEELFSKRDFVRKTLPGTGNANIRMVDFENAIKLVMVLPGKIARNLRAQFVHIIVRHLKSTGVFAQMARTDSINQVISFTLRRGKKADQTIPQAPRFPAFTGLSSQDCIVQALPCPKDLNDWMQKTQENDEERVRLNQQKIMLDQREVELSKQTTELEAKKSQQNGELDKQHSELCAWNDKLRKKEYDLGMLKSVLDAQDGNLNEQKIGLDQREKELTKQKTELKQLEIKLGERKDRLDQQEFELEQQEGYPTKRETEQDQRETGLDQRETGLDQREIKLNQKEIELGKQEAELIEQKAELGKQEAEMGQPIMAEPDDNALQAKKRNRETDLDFLAKAVSVFSQAKLLDDEDMKQAMKAKFIKLVTQE